MRAVERAGSCPYPGENSSREIPDDGGSKLHNAHPAPRAAFPRKITGRRCIVCCISYLY